MPWGLAGIHSRIQRFEQPSMVVACVDRRSDLFQERAFRASLFRVDSPG